jgi:hypothetical protein
MRKRYALAAAAVAALALGGATTAGAAPQPLEVIKGNNGTVKADVPGGGCTVVLDWYGMDSSASTTVEFRLHGASGDALLLSDTLTLDSDGASGGDLDGTRSYDLGAAVAASGATDAHVKVTTHTTYSQGADTKYKVVWVSGCEAPEEDPGPNE